MSFVCLIHRSAMSNSPKVRETWGKVDLWWITHLTAVVRLFEIIGCRCSVRQTQRMSVTSWWGQTCDRGKRATTVSDSSINCCLALPVMCLNMQYFMSVLVKPRPYIGLYITSAWHHYSIQLNHYHHHCHHASVVSLFLLVRNICNCMLVIINWYTNLSASLA